MIPYYSFYVYVNVYVQRKGRISGLPEPEGQTQGPKTGSRKNGVYRAPMGSNGGKWRNKCDCWFIFWIMLMENMFK